MNPLIFIFLVPVLFYLARKFFNGPKTNLSKDMSDKIIVITGASAGIGKETARDLLNKGATVIFAGRDENKTKNVIDKIIKNAKGGIPQDKAIFIRLDLASLQSVSDFAENLKKRFTKVDCLINNAGCCIEKYTKTADGVETTFQTNHLSHTALTALLIDQLNNSNDARVINVGSDAHTFAKNSKDFFKFDETLYQIFNSYAVSKLANVFLTLALKSYSEKNDLNIKSVCVHPGPVFTEVSRPENKSWYYKLFIYLIAYPIFFIIFKDEVIGAQTTLHCCYLDRENLIDGGYYQNCKLSKTGKQVQDKKFQNDVNSTTYNLIKNSLIYEKNEKNENFKNFVEYFKISF